jgi:hypothetical protein
VARREEGWGGGQGLFFLILLSLSVAFIFSLLTLLFVVAKIVDGKLILLGIEQKKAHIINVGPDDDVGTMKLRVLRMYRNKELDSVLHVA